MFRKQKKRVPVPKAVKKALKKVELQEAKSKKKNKKEASEEVKEEEEVMAEEPPSKEEEEPKKGKKNKKKKEEKKEKPKKKQKIGLMLEPKPSLKIIEGSLLAPNPKEHSKKLEFPYKGMSVSINNREPIYRVIRGDLQGLQKLVKDPSELSTFFQPFSVDIDKTAFEFALEQNNNEMIKLLLKELEKESAGGNKLVRANAPHFDLNQMTTGTQNKYQFGFKTRPVALSRGGKEGNNAFTYDNKLYVFYNFLTFI